MRKLLLDLGREQTLVDAHVAQRRIRLAPLHELLVEGIGDLLVIEPPRPLGKMLVRVVADGVALPRIGLQLRLLFLRLLQPAVAAGYHDRVREHAFGACLLVHLLARFEFHLVGEERVLLVHRIGTADAGDLGVAVEEDFLEVAAILRRSARGVKNTRPAASARGVTSRSGVGVCRRWERRVSSRVPARRKRPLRPSRFRGRRTIPVRSRGRKCRAPPRSGSSIPATRR